MNSSRACCLVLVAGLGYSLAAVQAQQRLGPPRPPGKLSALPREAESVTGGVTTTTPRSITFTPEREAAALTFVRAHRPELVPVLEGLSTHQPAGYQRAICDYFWISETLATIRHRDPQRYDLALRTWRLEALSHLLTSQLASQPTDAERLWGELEQTLRQLVDVQIETSAYDVKQQEAQLRRAQNRHQRLVDGSDELVRERLNALSQAIEQSVRPPADKRSTQATPSASTGVR